MLEEFKDLDSRIDAYPGISSEHQAKRAQDHSCDSGFSLHFVKRMQFL